LDLRFARLTLFQPALLRGFLGNGCFKQRKMVMETMGYSWLEKITMKHGDFTKKSGD
jgi:hypothetical protein